MTVRGTSPLAAYAHKGRYPSVGAGRAEALTGWSPMTEATFFPPSGSGKVWSEDLSLPFPMARFPCFPEGRPLPPYLGSAPSYSPRGPSRRSASGSVSVFPRRVATSTLPWLGFNSIPEGVSSPPCLGSAPSSSPKGQSRRFASGLDFRFCPKASRSSSPWFGSGEPFPHLSHIMKAEAPIL